MPNEPAFPLSLDGVMVMRAFAEAQMQVSGALARVKRAGAPPPPPPPPPPPFVP
jgi:hypothetical protein